MNIAIVSLSIIASAAVSFGSAVPLLIPDLVSLPTMDDWRVNHVGMSPQYLQVRNLYNTCLRQKIYDNHETIKFCVYLCKLQLHKPIQCNVSNMTEEVCC